MAAAAAAILHLEPSQAGAAEPGETAAPYARSVTVAQAKRICFVDTLEVTGVLVPRNEIQVRPDREGLQISQVIVEPGDSVTSGQVLARLKQPDGTGSDVAVAAPAAGFVYSAAAPIGATASARGEPLFRIARQGEMELVGETPVNTMYRLSVDQPAKIEVIGVGELSGKVRLISTAVNATTQLGQVYVFLGTDTRLRVGAFGRAAIEVDRRCGPAIPLSAVLYGLGGAVVQVVRNNRIETRRVTVGLFKDEQAEIREGVVEGETVVARAGAFVRDGDLVRAGTLSATPGSR